ncbi:TIGR02530 family flagellar biosynthesis protein [Sediminibacillus halophilus]|uniref:Flagellar operon protein n=1 Tax=Sediminibacillus halophilus TaxID=482461 RepID=A0A1G9MIK9_9BACI|nr:TIGR02530 family flagellar biosynthesis protein [Sediminibacillus halophilus]SDL73974.1 flagellar operon protein [Sediminibacillus halophilus]
MEHRIQSLQHPITLLPKSTKTKTSKQTNFKDALLNVQSLKVSKHAKQRMNERNIAIDQEQWQKITAKVGEAKQKGITDSLVLTDNAALLISTKNNTVVTAMDRSEAGSRIFTNINGTIVMDN